MQFAGNFKHIANQLVNINVIYSVSNGFYAITHKGNVIRWGQRNSP